MTFEQFDKCMVFIRTWRSKHDKDDNQWPDSRDPALTELMVEFGVTAQQLEKSMVALAAWREAGEDVYQAMSTILQVIKNRQLKGMYRTHLVDDEQFPAMVSDDMNNNIYPGKTDNFIKILENLDDILDNKVVDLTQGAVYFGQMANLQPWLKSKMKSGSVERTTQAGKFTFYKDSLIK